MPGAGGELILLVDDNRDACDLLSEMFRLAGYAVEQAYDADQALAIAARAVPAVAVLDIGLPAMDGFELAARLRADPRLAATRLVAMTGYSEAADRERAVAAGFDTHLVKPVSFADLRGAVSALLAAPRAT